MRRTRIEPSYFDKLYAEARDPWRFESSAYELAKYEATLEALPIPIYPSALEVGCSIGVFTERLARRCGRLLAIDCAEQALDSARQRCANLPNVEFAQIAAPEQWPAGSFDLVVLSEVVYYFAPAMLDLLVQRVKASIRPGGHIILVHWLGDTDYPLSGDDAVTAFLVAAQDFASLRLQQRQIEYRLDLLQAR
ncbi:Methyltransferase type 12 [Methylocella silvestris BL2]|uniref:Methyltransferase type 12 n=1 Tax=Methylocella silvestris (strain DSM 15510 / CIP 108128 / LMG 27833 / NCIMB 13906 / BL2) TaxID=395965 RepID=B8EIY9_METSB|nr:class I SAM-dependent methyltransferase [Methylocella silvestris]ACK52481.1 Methyltransferase type 12 [Methylocella silvestris BL2]